MSNLTKNNKTTIQITITIIVIAGGLFAYLNWYVAPDEVTERVKMIANTPDGCIAESSDGFSVNIGPCDAEPGEFIIGTYDAKIKERRALMNPTT
ncbi:hypothetical protein [Nitrosopumilus piranensis]|uniref:Uncharacterized protein n=1 Tax=Nitrosopumilus piranensis TaxID=1582439 RepID=A0A0C5BTT7_9ARCH|nr:hypothetical protein [Nitrosopumilus piranensis]AJM91584.1 conserved exported protein of unknown function [Nitrosopumilus piranensis]